MAPAPPAYDDPEKKIRLSLVSGRPEVDSSNWTSRTACRTRRPGRRIQGQRRTRPQRPAHRTRPAGGQTRGPRWKYAAPAGGGSTHAEQRASAHSSR